MTARSPSPAPLPLRWAMILLVALVAALLTGMLTFAQTTSWPAALLAASGAAGATVLAAHQVLADQ